MTSGWQARCRGRQHRSVVRAWQTFGQAAGTSGLVHGGTASELVTNYGQAGQPMFTEPPGCYLDHEASFITCFYTQDKLGSHPGAHPRPKLDFNFIPFPPLTSACWGTAEVAGDLLGMFRNTPGGTAQADRLPDNTSGTGSLDHPAG